VVVKRLVSPTWSSVGIKLVVRHETCGHSLAHHGRAQGGILLWAGQSEPPSALCDLLLGISGSWHHTSSPSMRIWAMALLRSTTPWRSV